MSWPSLLNGIAVGRHVKPSEAVYVLTSWFGDVCSRFSISLMFTVALALAPTDW